MKGITEETFLSHVRNHSAREVIVQCVNYDPVARTEQWTVSLRLGDSRNRLTAVRSKREPVRTWASLTAVGRFLRGRGVMVFTVELGPVTPVNF